MTARSETEALPLRHEPESVRLGLVGGTALVLLAVVLAAALGLRTVVDFPAVQHASRLKFLDENPFRLESRYRDRPLLERSPREENAAYRRREREILESYGWLDRARGRVRIPIERAMEQVVREGFPVENGGASR